MVHAGPKQQVEPDAMMSWLKHLAQEGAGSFSQDQDASHIC